MFSCQNLHSSTVCHIVSFWRQQCRLKFAERPRERVLKIYYCVSEAYNMIVSAHLILPELFVLAALSVCNL